MKVLIVANSRKTKGGITTVLNMWQDTYVWKKYHCYWLETQINAGYFKKIYYMISSYIKAVFIVPRYDIVHFHTVLGISTIVQLPIFLLTLLCRKKIIVHIHVGNQLLASRNDKIFEFILHKASKIIVLSNMSKKIIESYFDCGDKVEVLYNPSPRVIRNDVRHNYILYMAYMIPNKGYDVLLKGFAKVCREFPDWSLVMAGTGELDNAKHIIKELGIEKRVEIRGWVSGKEKDKLFYNAGGYCMTSYQEGFPMTVLEAWSYGVPLITTPVGGLPDVLIDSKNALIFDFGNIEQLSDKLKILFSDPLLREQLAFESRLLSETTFNIKEIVKKLDRIYHNI